MGAQEGEEEEEEKPGGWHPGGGGRGTPVRQGHRRPRVCDRGAQGAWSLGEPEGPRAPNSSPPGPRDPIKAQKSGCWPPRWWGRPLGGSWKTHRAQPHAFRSEHPGRRTRATAAFGLAPAGPPPQAIHPTEPPRTEASKKVAGERGEASPLLSAGPPRRRPAAHTPAGQRPVLKPAVRSRPSIPPRGGACGHRARLPTLGHSRSSRARELFLQRTNTFQSSKSK